MRSSSKPFRKPEKRAPSSLAEAREKLSHFCSYQERNLRQVNQKMKSLGVQEDWFEPILEYLISEGYLNENRYAAGFVRGKSQGRGWGPKKIAFRLRREGIAQDKIDQTLSGTDWQRAESKLREALIKKKAELEKKKDPNWRPKLIRFCLSRGFDLDKSQAILKSQFSDWTN